MYPFILFPDFDGVMHPGTSGTMRHVPKFEAFLARYPDVLLVPSSNWRETESLDDLRNWFSPAFASRIIDVTPVLHLPGRGSRQTEIETWLGQHPARHWRAIDDDASLFRPDCRWLITTDPRTGLNDETFRQLAQVFDAAGLRTV